MQKKFNWVNKDAKVKNALWMKRKRANKLLMQHIKCLLDLAIAIPSVIILSPVFTLIGFFVRMKIGSPVLFKQVRPGLQGKPFVIYKFITMTDELDENGRFLPDGERLTRFGRLLRKTSLDELPELFNVIKGDMSIVGPRPLLMQYLDRYTPEQARRHEVKPGITGWAQVNGRNIITWEQKFEYDVWYVDNWSLWMDVKIIAMTVMKVLKREGISQKGEATMEEFIGHAKTQRCLKISRGIKNSEDKEDYDL